MSECVCVCVCVGGGGGRQHGFDKQNEEGKKEKKAARPSLSAQHIPVHIRRKATSIKLILNSITHFHFISS